MYDFSDNKINFIILDIGPAGGIRDSQWKMLPWLRYLSLALTTHFVAVIQQHVELTDESFFLLYHKT